jgi:sodium/proline symporter
MIGVVGITLVHYAQLPAESLTGPASDPERILPVLVSQLMPAWIAGILIAGAVAAMMSTADSQLLITTSTIVEDFYDKALNRKLSQRSLVTLSRVVTVLIGLAAFALAKSSNNLIYDVVSMAWAGLGSSFGPSLLLSLHWKRMNSTGVLASMLTGAVSTAFWMAVPGLNSLISVRFVSFALATAAAVAGSLASRRDRDPATRP